MAGGFTPLYLFDHRETDCFCGSDAIADILAATSLAPTGLEFDMVVDVLLESTKDRPWMEVEVGWLKTVAF